MLLVRRGSHDAARYVDVSMLEGIQLYKSMYAFDRPCTRRLQQAVGMFWYLCSKGGKQRQHRGCHGRRVRDGKCTAFLYREHASTSSPLASRTSFCTPLRVMAVALPK